MLECCVGQQCLACVSVSAKGWLYRQWHEVIFTEQVCEQRRDKTDTANIATPIVGKQKGSTTPSNETNWLLIPWFLSNRVKTLHEVTASQPRGTVTVDKRLGTHTPYYLGCRQLETMEH